MGTPPFTEANLIDRPLPRVDEDTDDIVRQVFYADNDLQAQINVLSAAVAPRGIVLADVKSATTAGGGIVADTWTPRDIGTLYDPYSVGWLVSRTSTSVTLAGGLTYRISWTAPGYAIARYQTRAWNITDAAAIDPPGTSEVSLDIDTQTHSVGECFLSEPGNIELRIEQICSTSKTVNGLGAPNNTFVIDNVYTILRIAPL